MSDQPQQPPVDWTKLLRDIVDAIDDCAYNLGRASVDDGTYSTALVRYGLARRAFDLWLDNNPGSAGGVSDVAG